MIARALVPPTPKPRVGKSALSTPTEKPTWWDFLLETFLLTPIWYIKLPPTSKTCLCKGSILLASLLEISKYLLSKSSMSSTKEVCRWFILGLITEMESGSASKYSLTSNLEIGTSITASVPALSPVLYISGSSHWAGRRLARCITWIPCPSGGGGPLGAMLPPKHNQLLGSKSFPALMNHRACSDRKAVETVRTSPFGVVECVKQSGRKSKMVPASAVILMTSCWTGNAAASGPSFVSSSIAVEFGPTNCTTRTRPRRHVLRKSPKILSSAGGWG